MAERIIFHIDVNSAFLAWTATYRCQVLGETEDLRQIPSAIVGDKKDRHGVVLAKSLPAKAFGVKTGEPLHIAQQKCPHLVTAAPDYKLYTRASRKFIEYLKTVTPLVEQFSIDEAWMDMTGTNRLHGDPVVAARQLKDQIREQLGFTVNIGISNNKLLAKIAGDFEKPDKVHTLFPWEMAEKFWPLPVRELFLVGRATEEKLRKMGIHTIGELAHADLRQIRKQLHKPGEQLWHYANGRCDMFLKPIPDDNKGYGNSTTTAFDMTEYEQADKVLLSLCETVGMRLRKDGKAASCVAVRTRTNRFLNNVHQMQIHGATDATDEIYRTAQLLLRQMWDRDEPLRQLGVQVTKLASESYIQQDLFGQAPQKLSDMDQTLDHIREKYGENSIMRAAFLEGEQAAMGGGLAPERRTGITKPLGPDDVFGRPEW